VLAAGGEHDLLYVGEEHRVQEFESDGAWKAEIPLTGTVEAMALEGTTGNLYVAYREQGIVHEFAPEGKELSSFEVHASEENGIVRDIGAIAIDSTGHIAVSADEESKGPFGSLYDGASLRLLPGFSIPERGASANVKGIGFNGAGELYVAVSTHEEIVSFRPEPVAEPIVGSATCNEGAEKETSVVSDCVLNGEVNPYDVANTEVWFEWGRKEGNKCALVSETPMKPVATVEALVPVSAPIEGLRPNEGFCYRLDAADKSVQLSEKITSETASLRTPVVLAKITGGTQASFITSSSAVLFGELNPENAPTEYFFEYAPEVAELGENTLHTSSEESALYGGMGATIEAVGLQPSTNYRYRLAASNEGGKSHGIGPSQEGTFTTAAAPRVEAETGTASEISSRSALVSGTVNPDGQPATYTFQLGVYHGAATQFGTVFSGPTGTGMEVKSLLLTGLQPGTEYAYQLRIASGYGSATGATVRFTTEGLPAALIAPNPLPQLSAPKIPFPKVVQLCKRGYTRDKRNKCVKEKKTKTKTVQGTRKKKKK
jgi:hypothetical protein